MGRTGGAARNRGDRAQAGCFRRGAANPQELEIVGYHLRKVFTKLGSASRTELIRGGLPQHGTG